MLLVVFCVSNVHIARADKLLNWTTTIFVVEIHILLSFRPTCLLSTVMKSTYTISILCEKSMTYMYVIYTYLVQINYFVIAKLKK